MPGRGRRAVLLFAAAGVLAATTLAVPTSAFGKCQPPRTNDFETHRWDGWRDLSGVATGGVYSEIWNYSPWVRSGSRVFAYSMLRNFSGSLYAQVGWTEVSGGIRSSFLEWTHDGTWTRHTKSPRPTNTFSYYTVLYNNTPGKFTFQIEGTTWETQTAQFSPTASEIMGETLSAADQMPGSTSDHENFWDSHKYQSGAWKAYSGTVYNDNTSWYGNSVSSSYADNIWDKACSS